MRPPRMLKERVLEIAKEPELARSLFPLVRDFGKHQYAYAVYLARNPPEMIFGHISDTLSEGWKPGFTQDFREFIIRNPPKSFMDTVFLLDFYHFNAVRLHHRYAPNRLEFTPIGIIYDMLKDSRGVLLWHYQLENLIRLFISDNAKVVRLRKDINAQRRSAYDLTQHMQLSENVTLEKIITERMLFFNTCAPNFKGAMALFGYCD